MALTLSAASASVLGLRVFNVSRYGAVPDGSDVTDGLLAAWAALTAHGSGMLLLPAGVYPVEVGASVDLFHAASLSNVAVAGRHASIVDTAGYGPGETGRLFRFTGCRSVAVDVGRVESTVSTADAGEGSIGLDAFRFDGGGDSVSVRASVGRCRKAVDCVRAYSDPASGRVSGVRARLTASNVFYPLNCQYSGDDLTASIDADHAGRTYFAYGVTNHRVRVRTRNQLLTSMIGPYDSVRNLDLVYVDRDSDGSVDGGDAISIRFRPTNGTVAHSNLSLTVDLKNRLDGQVYAFDHGVSIYKDTGAEPPEYDTEGRGHSLTGCRIYGRVEQPAGTFRLPISNSGDTFVSPDTVTDSVAAVHTTGPDSTVPDGMTVTQLAAPPPTPLMTS